MISSRDCTPCCGPAGWAYPDWNAAVYPRPKPRGFHALEYLAEHLDTVEINTSFHQPLKPEISRLWVDRVGANRSFRFTAKLGRRFTHDRNPDAESVAAFKEGLWPIHKAGRLGCVLMQFPWAFRFTSENREFFIQLRRAFHEFPLAAEMRHSSWLLDEAVGTFIDYRVGFCNIDQPEHTRAMPPSAILTSPVAYFRLHGHGGAGWMREFDGEPPRGHGNRYVYSRAELEAWRTRIAGLAEHAERTFVTFTNDAGGAAVANALQLQSLFDEGRKRAPASLVARYPGQLAGFGTGRAVQGMLFAA
ncbi:MAG: DUF72 domain-containing protein [Acidobacteria bacterium]|nr:DUF72 domain-containing protein [Acidobacteriota bacterium]